MRPTRLAGRAVELTPPGRLRLPCIGADVAEADNLDGSRSAGAGAGCSGGAALRSSTGRQRGEVLFDDCVHRREPGRRANESALEGSRESGLAELGPGGADLRAPFELARAAALQRAVTPRGS